MKVSIGRIEISDVSLDELDAIVTRYSGDVPAIKSSRPKHAPDPEITTKVCRKCGLEKPVAEFYANNEKRDGLRTECKVCHNLRLITTRNPKPPDDSDASVLSEISRRLADGAECVMVKDLPWAAPRVRDVCWKHRSEWHYRAGGRGGVAAIFHRPDPRYESAVRVGEVNLGLEVDDDPDGDGANVEWLEDQLPNEGDEEPLDELFPNTEDHAGVRAIIERDARFALVAADGVVNKSQLVRRVKLDAPREITGRVST